jgi:hypothetical protein
MVEHTFVEELAMLGSRCFLILCVMAALAPVVPWQIAAKPLEHHFPGWPTDFEGRELTELPLSGQEQSFRAGFPGRMAKFTDGRRTIVIRWVRQETRKLHPAGDCFRAWGYHVVALPLHKNAHQQFWGSFLATSDGERLVVRERIYDTADSSWTDASAWYWAALLGKTTGPWWAMTVVEPQEQQETKREDTVERNGF